MEFFKTLLFGISGLSLIFWVAVIGLWHVDMFPRFFKEDRSEPGYSPASNSQSNASTEENVLMPLGVKGLFNRGKYSRQSFVIADFSPIEEGYSVNRLYASLIMSIGIASFIILGYGLHSGLTLPT